MGQLEEGGGTERLAQVMPTGQFCERYSLCLLVLSRLHQGRLRLYISG